MLFNIDNGKSSDGVLHTIVVREGWKGFRYFVRGMRAFSESYYDTKKASVDYTLFKYCADGVTTNELEAKELYWWCINHDVI